MNRLTNEDLMKIHYKDKQYELRDGIWFLGYKKAPQDIQDRLNSQVENELHAWEEDLTEVSEILEASKLAEKRKDLLRALVLARKAYETAD